MKTTIICLITSFALFSLIAKAESYTASKDEVVCYAKAMIGYDSVINARLGVLPDELVEQFGYRTPAEQDYMNIMLNAYSWEATPHQYANFIFFECAQKAVLSKIEEEADLLDEQEFLFHQEQEFREDEMAEEPFFEEEIIVEELIKTGVWVEV